MFLPVSGLSSVNKCCSSRAAFECEHVLAFLMKCGLIMLL
jgi:hypothetical protein